MLLWKDVAVELRNLGPAFVAIMVFTLLLMLVTEPRFINFCWPFVVFSTVRTLDRRKISTAFTVGFGALAVLFSKLWLPINLAPWTGGDFDRLTAWPKQAYFLNFGLWMSWSSFLLQAVVVVTVGVGLARALKHLPKYDALHPRSEGAI